MTIDPDTMVFVIFVLAGTAGAYFIGYAMDGVMREDGFGILLNTMILVAGGFLGFYANERLYLPFHSLTAAAVMVVSGGFLCLALLAILKGLMRRAGY